jgi:drug/metabolite transporter (DMT)-like permease
MIGSLKAKTQSTTWPYIVILSGYFIGAGGPILIRLAQSEGIPSLVIVAYRQIFSLIFFTPFVLGKHRHELRQITPRDLMFAALAGIVMAARFLLVFEAYNNTSILIVSVISGSSPLWVALAETVFLKAALSRNIWLGLFLALAGGVVIAFAGFDGGTSLGNNAALGVFYALTSTILLAIYLNLGRSIRNRISFWPYIWLIFLFAAITSLLATFAAGMPLTGYSAKGYLWLVALTITAQVIAHGAINYVLAYVSATFVSISSQVSNVVSVLLAYLIFAELPGPLQIVGSVIIIVGVIIATLRPKAKAA